MPVRSSGRSAQPWIRPAAERVQLRLNWAGTMDATLAWGRHLGNTCPHWVCYANAAPGAAVRIGAELTALDPEVVVLIPPWITYDCVITAPTQHTWALFDLVGIPATLVRERFRARLIVPRGALLAPLVALASDALRRALAAGADYREPEASFAVKAWTHAVMAQVWRRLSAADIKRLSAASLDPRVAPALDRIASALDRPLANLELARLCGLSERQFLAVFRAHLGASPAQYVLERRVSEAALLLSDSELSIPAIASACGFPDRYYFSRAFTRRMGTPPAAYRRMQLRRTLTEDEPPR
jgi:AraC family transcriptional regulator of arabinose operon